MGAKWMWSEAHQSAFETVKRALESELALAHYDPRLSTALTVDRVRRAWAPCWRSSRRTAPRVIAFASRALTQVNVFIHKYKRSDRDYFGVKSSTNICMAGQIHLFSKPIISHFYQYLGTKGIPEMTANRLQRYALFLSAYNYTVQYVRSANNVADYLSRSHPQARAADGSGAGTCAASVDVEDGEINSYLHFISSNDQSSITIKEIKVETQNDPMLHSVVNFIRNEDGCILRGHKVVIPLNLQGRILRELHSSHFGVVKTKAEARRRFWWPGIDADIESAVGACGTCTALRPAPARAPPAPWPYPARPWERVHLDMLSVAGGSHLVVVDAHSKWVEWAPLADGAGTEPVLRRLSERALKTLMSETNSVSSLEHQVNKYLLSYRNSVHSTTGVSPAQLMLGRNVRTRLDLLCPRKDVPKHVAPAPITGVVSTYSRTNSVSKETRRSVITLARWRRRLHSGHPQAAYEHYNSDESDDDYTFVKCSPMLMTERGRRKSKPRQHEARIVRTKGSLPKIAARS
ncbi:Uncharacterized protein K02A2.6 [Eumeta japonica]|uniref:RNA-directed DNA polymerase n=1 Tax=Eumeta variegata TaxID=151549 RepID=A0A4C1V0F2_EUMVA|nr:Uncharacterized protein K02A2.6 [Eumeta japonica]